MKTKENNIIVSLDDDLQRIQKRFKVQKIKIYHRMKRKANVRLVGKGHMDKKTRSEPIIPLPNFWHLKSVGGFSLEDSSFP